MRAVAGPSRWLWGTSGLVTVALLAIPGTHLITSAGVPQNQYAQPSSIAIRTFTVPQLVTSLDVNSYGAPVQVTAGPVRRVQVTEMIQYDSKGDYARQRMRSHRPSRRGRGCPSRKGTGCQP